MDSDCAAIWQEEYAETAGWWAMQRVPYLTACSGSTCEAADFDSHGACCVPWMPWDCNDNSGAFSLTRHCVLPAVIQVNGALTIVGDKFAPDESKWSIAASNLIAGEGMFFLDHGNELTLVNCVITKGTNRNKNFRGGGGIFNNGMCSSLS